MNMKITLFVVGLFICFFTIFKFYNYNLSKTNNLPYKNFISNIKSENFLEAYTVLYPLVESGDKKAIEIISTAYANNGYGVKKDLIKSNIWKYRSEFGKTVGEQEFQKFKTHLESKDFNYASPYLQNSAEMGNKSAITLIKDDKYIINNSLNIDENWRKYWKTFNYDELYPFYKEMNLN